jgi:hypothetical protein
LPGSIDLDLGVTAGHSGGVCRRHHRHVSSLHGSATALTLAAIWLVLINLRGVRAAGLLPS